MRHALLALAALLFAGPALADDRQLTALVARYEAYSLADDPITHLRYSAEAHRHAAVRLCGIAGECCEGRLLALGGGGYNRANIAKAWTAVLEALVESLGVKKL